MKNKEPKRRSMRNYHRLYEHHKKALATINNLFIETHTIVQALTAIKNSRNFASNEFRVPSTKGRQH